MDDFGQQADAEKITPLSSPIMTSFLLAAVPASWAGGKPRPAPHHNGPEWTTSLESPRFLSDKPRAKTLGHELTAHAPDRGVTTPKYIATICIPLGQLGGRNHRPGAQEKHAWKRLLAAEGCLAAIA